MDEQREQVPDIVVLINALLFGLAISALATFGINNVKHGPLYFIIPIGLAICVAFATPRYFQRYPKGLGWTWAIAVGFGVLFAVTLVAGPALFKARQNSSNSESSSLR